VCIYICTLYIHTQVRDSPSLSPPQRVSQDSVGEGSLVEGSVGEGSVSEGSVSSWIAGRDVSRTSSRTLSRPRGAESPQRVVAKFLKSTPYGD
jgi:hypothetical protein